MRISRCDLMNKHRQPVAKFNPEAIQNNEIMAELSDLPAELIARVVAYFVKKEGLVQAWKMRGVCSTSPTSLKSVLRLRRRFCLPDTGRLRWLWTNQ